MTGFINVNKEKGASSAKEVARIKRLTCCPCGHMGTLDPMATGVLPVALGNAARLFDYFLAKRKTYVAEFTFGIETDTLDATGAVTKSGGYIPAAEEIIGALPQFTGSISQLPPKFSAKSVGGKRAYELARSGEDFELKPKTVEIYSIKLLERISDCAYSFEIECGGGTYIRSLARDLGERLGTCAVMSSLVRTRSGIFSIANAVKTCDLTADNIKDYIIPTESVLPFPEIHPDERESKKLFNGISVETCLDDGIYKIFNENGAFYGIAEAGNNLLRVKTKLC